MTPAARDNLAQLLAQILCERYAAQHPQPIAPLPAPVALLPNEAQNPAQ